MFRFRETSDTNKWCDVNSIIGKETDTQEMVKEEHELKVVSVARASLGKYGQILKIVTYDFMFA